MVSRDLAYLILPFQSSEELSGINLCIFYLSFVDKGIPNVPYDLEIPKSLMYMDTAALILY